MENDPNWGSIPELREEQESVARMGLALLGLVEGFGDEVTAKDHANGWLLACCVSGVFASLNPKDVLNLRGIPGREGITPRSDGVQECNLILLGATANQGGGSAALKMLREWLLNLADTGLSSTAPKAFFIRVAISAPTAAGRHCIHLVSRFSSATSYAVFSRFPPAYPYNPRGKDRQSQAKDGFVWTTQGCQASPTRPRSY
jgi:hypothetical protein